MVVHEVTEATVPYDDYDAIGWFGTDIAKPKLWRALGDGYTEANPPGPDFLRLVERAPIAAPCASLRPGCQYPQGVPGESERYLASEGLLFEGKSLRHKRTVENARPDRPPTTL